jgi:ABC-type amino acid transport substrate-binding protein
MANSVITQQTRTLTSNSNNYGTNGLSYVMMESTELINILKDLEGLKRRIQRKLNGG